MLAVIVKVEQLFQRLDPSGTVPRSPRSGFSLAAEEFRLEHNYPLARDPDALVSKTSDKSDFPFLNRGKLASDLFRLAESRDSTSLAVSARRPGPPSACPCNSEYILIYRGGSVARPNSEDRRNTILDAATILFAQRGLSAAPTSEILKHAGVAEGTLFTYFKTKDDLIDARYREIKLELADAMMSDFPRKKNVPARPRHVWDRYVNWGIANPKQRKVLTQLQVSEVLTQESRDASSAPFVEFQIRIRDAFEQRVIRNDLPVELYLQVVSSFGGGDDRPYVVEPIQSNKILRWRL